MFQNFWRGHDFDIKLIREQDDNNKSFKFVKPSPKCKYCTEYMIQVKFDLKIKVCCSSQLHIWYYSYVEPYVNIWYVIYKYVVYCENDMFVCIQSVVHVIYNEFL